MPHLLPTPSTLLNGCNIDAYFLNPSYKLSISWDIAQVLARLLKHDEGENPSSRQSKVTPTRWRGNPLRRVETQLKRGSPARFYWSFGNMPMSRTGSGDPVDDFKFANASVWRQIQPTANGSFTTKGPRKIE